MQIENDDERVILEPPAQGGIAQPSRPTCDQQNNQKSGADDKIGDSQPAVDPVVAARLGRVVWSRGWISGESHALLEVSHYCRAKCGVSGRSSATAKCGFLVPNKTLRGCQDFGHQLRGSGFCVSTKQRLRSRSTEQDPRFRSVAVCWRIEKKLDAIEVFLFHHAIASQALGAFGSGPLNRALLDLFWNVQIAPAVVGWAELPLQIRNQGF